MVFNAIFNNISVISWQSVPRKKPLICHKSLTNVKHIGCKGTINILKFMKISKIEPYISEMEIRDYSKGDPIMAYL